MTACLKCATCTRGQHHSCTGFDGPITTHPDSLPLCSCLCTSSPGRKEQE